MSNPVTVDKPGETVLLMGNEAQKINREAKFDFEQFSYIAAGFDKLFYGRRRKRTRRSPRSRSSSTPRP